MTLESEVTRVKRVGTARGGPEFVTRPALSEQIEAKCHLDIADETAKQHKLPLKRDFAVNHEAVSDSYGLGVRLMLPIVAAPGGLTAVVGRCLLLADVLLWQPTEYGHEHPALAVPLDRASQAVWGDAWADLQRHLHSTRPSVRLELLTRVHHGGIARFRELREDPGFDLSGRTIGEVIELCTPVARACLQR